MACSSQGNLSTPDSPLRTKGQDGIYEEQKHSASVGASSLASRTTRESSIREQTRAYEKPKLGARMNRAEGEA